MAPLLHKAAINRKLAVIVDSRPLWTVAVATRKAQSATVIQSAT